MTTIVDDRVQGFLKDCQDRGFDPATAFVLYQELNAVAAPTVVNEALASDEDRLGMAVRGRLRDAVLAVKSPEDWRTYCAQWVAVACDRPAGTVDLAAKKAFIVQVGKAWSQWVPHEGQQDLIARLTGMAAGPGMARYVEAAEGMTWERLAQVVQADRMPWAWDAPAADHEASAQLDQALRDTSVRSVRWNWIDGDGAAQRATLAQGLNRAQQEMQDRTRWEGPVLGLDGQMRLSFGNEHAATGYAMPTEDGSTLIVTSPQAGWGVVSHEWLHAFDQICARRIGIGSPGDCLSQDWSSGLPVPAQGTPAQQQTVAAFNTLLDHLMVQAPGPDVRAQGLAEAQASWAERITTILPWSAAIVADEQARLDDGSWTRQTSMTAWRQGYLDDGRPLNEAGTLAETMVTEVEFLATVTAQAGQGASVWREYLDRFEDNLQRHHGKDTPYAGYFQRPEEVLAHSFESTFQNPATLVTDVHAGRSSLRYPTAPEGRWQAQAWATFFSSTRAGWCEMAGIAPTVDAVSGPATTVPAARPLMVPSLNGLGARIDQRTAGNDEQVTLAARVTKRPAASRTH